MQVYKCHPLHKPIDACVQLPGSKSLTNRALIAAAMADGTSLLQGLLLSEDTRLMVDVLGTLGVTITIDEVECMAEVTGCRGELPVSDANLSCGNAGTVMRFCTALVATGVGCFELHGVARMHERPIGALVDVLRALGAGIEYAGVDGYPPLVVHANGLHGGRVALSSPPSSQFVSALLLAAPYASRDVLVEVTGDVPSVPYLRMTTAVMDAFSVPVVEQYEEGGARFIVAAPQRYCGTTYRIDPDASNATYFLAAPGIAGGSVRVDGLGTSSVQGDVCFVDVLERMGCRVERAGDSLCVAGPADGERLRGIDVDLNDMPDTVQTLAVLALFAEGPTMIRNVANLRVKETDRLAALTCELSKLGASVEEFDDGIRISPPAEITPATIETYDDHRMAMSFALVGLKVPGVVINNPSCCGKTFPDFFERFERLGD